MRWALGSDALCRPSQNAVPAHVPVRLVLAPVAPARAVPLVGAQVRLAPVPVVPLPVAVPIVMIDRVGQAVRLETGRVLLGAHVETLGMIARLAVLVLLAPAARRARRSPEALLEVIGSIPVARATVRDDPTEVLAPTVPADRFVVRRRAATGSNVGSAANARHAATGPTDRIGHRAPIDRVPIVRVEIDRVPIVRVEIDRADNDQVDNDRVPIDRRGPATTETIVLPGPAVSGPIAVIGRRVVAVDRVVDRVVRPVPARGAVRGARCVPVAMRRGRPDRAVS